MIYLTGLLREEECDLLLVVPQTVAQRLAEEVHAALVSEPPPDLVQRLDVVLLHAQESEEARCGIMPTMTNSGQIKSTQRAL